MFCEAQEICLFVCLHSSFLYGTAHLFGLISELFFSISCFLIFIVYY